MTGATARQRAAIAISFSVQAVMIAALLGVPALGSAHHVQAAPATSVPAAQPVLSPQPDAPATPPRLTLSVWVDGVDNAVDVPTRGPGTLPVRVNYVPPGRAVRVAVMFADPGSPPSVTNVWFAIAPAAAPDHHLPPLGGSQGSMVRLTSTARWLSPGVRWFLFTVPAADLRDGYPIIVMGARQGSFQVTYGIAQLHAP